MQIDYKFWYIKKDDNGFITECTVRFYEGSTMPVSVTHPITGDTIQMDKHVRTKRLKKVDMPDNKSATFVPEGVTQNEVAVYTSDDFGVTDDEDVVRAFLNTEIAKDNSRTPISVQSQTNLVEIRKQSVR